jgi:entericidin B
MMNGSFGRAIVLVVALLALQSCANTIRGIGKDTANTVNATQSAGHKVAHAATQ